MTTTYRDVVEITANDGGLLGQVELELNDDEIDLIDLTVTDEDGAAALTLTVVEAERLIAKLAVKVAQARAAEAAR